MDNELSYSLPAWSALLFFLLRLSAPAAGGAMGSADEVNIQATELNRTMKVCPQHNALRCCALCMQPEMWIFVGSVE